MRRRELEPGRDGPARVLVVVGTRPEAIKMAPVLAALGRRGTAVEARLALTGQHTDMVEQVLEAFSLEPSWDLEIMRPGQTLYDVVHRALDGLRDVVRAWRPDVLLVQGDTATVFVGSLVAFLERVRVGHVEAGLRSGDKWAPFPEEMFRRLSDVLSDWYFAPTLRARDALLTEGVPAHRVHVTGNTVVDALRTVAERPREPRDAALRRVLEEEGRLVLLTAHRRESFGEPLREALAAVRSLAEADETLRVLYPVHPNPNVKGPAQEILGGHPRIHLTGPLDYLDLVAALREADLVLTDSGGIQEEAPTFGAPVLVLREVTERPEGIEAGVAELVGTDAGRIVARSRAALGRPRTDGGPNPYGDGRAGERIADILLAELSGTDRETEEWAP
jgi:UDP-N-acetylglucosamine 2-epimerase (non-hydrolysing)